MADLAESEHVKPRMRPPMGVRLGDAQFAYIERLRHSNDVDRSRQVRRMIAFCQLNMPDNWVPPLEE